MAERGDSSDEEPTIAEDVVVTKYKMAGDMANRILKTVIDGCIEGAKVLDLCQLGDQMILEEAGKVFKKEKEMKKGIAFPTCISVNNCVCHFSPLKSDPLVTLVNGNLVKVELGVHVDGFIAAVAHTTVVGCSKDNKVTGRLADVLMAGHIASEIAYRMVVPGGESLAVTDAINRVGADFKCSPVEGILSHRLKKNLYDSEKTIILNPSDSQKREYKSSEFELHEVYAIDVIISTGDGKSRQQDTRTTVYKRTEDNYNLRMKSSRAFFSEVCSKFDVMPFSLRSFEEEGKARMGVVECTNHNLLEPFHVLYEKEGEFVAQFKFTVLLMPNGPLKITNTLFDPSVIESTNKLEDAELKTLLATSVSKKAKKKKKKAGKSSAATDEAETGTNDD
ncbi:PREDICTED: proliferation-associated protein 2G4-like isoform X1 [Amphimedon queenslandica]|uniref:Peptidase M24 domain-containing protein n=2 Tax=Amphimedon queenslandica TaxID=400682 RepID=A0AAN0I9Q1_AMPQE|nr:PREDICTED: proliferation-associated protein 2G4-like isoform X1 [Amphimedon queenslandica]|eukprot:XP_003383390.1 PREDICTED: proliferation-associated protein 2G4-like isoform X1 [Amphimedon queenslandica]